MSLTSEPEKRPKSGQKFDPNKSNNQFVPQNYITLPCTFITHATHITLNI